MPAKQYPTEFQEQAALIEWASVRRHRDRRLSEWFVLINNESLMSLLTKPARRYAYWGRLVKMGFRRGASDLLLACPESGYAGLWLEMKRQRAAYGGEAAQANAVRDEQAEFHEQMRAAGYATSVAYGWHEATQVIEAYLGGRP